jgi:hypothetical protein
MPALFREEVKLSVLKAAFESKGEYVIGGWGQFLDLHSSKYH